MDGGGGGTKGGTDVDGEGHLGGVEASSTSNPRRWIQAEDDRRRRIRARDSPAEPVAHRWRRPSSSLAAGAGRRRRPPPEEAGGTPPPAAQHTEEAQAGDRLPHPQAVIVAADP
ncbi:hypothetical protein OsI_15094 [Oryza sativa Indica Group]|uniref:Uncharacterized protein n=1 Tax=Oryza sativa subsp. indica TaxID=39946 RepID=B8ARM4_ORYSI|nr:hypothetical protein OsI_15094 [Oryza sativa Indica Group]